MQVKIQGGRRIRRLRHQHQHKQHEKSQYKYQATTMTDIKQQKYEQPIWNHIYNNNNNHQQQQQRQWQQYSLSSTASSSDEQTTIAGFVAAKPQKSKRLQLHLKPEFHLQQQLPQQPQPQPQTQPQPRQLQRMKRSISSPRHVETLIVADPTMVVFHDDIETYLLTIMNMVSALYKDPSIGNAIEIVVVRIVLLDDNDAHPDLNLTQNAQQNLDTFCR